MRPLLLAGIVAAVALAGCSGGGSAKDDTLTPADVEVDAGSRFGAISGVVVDETIRPIAGATVRLLPTTMEATTDEGGLFTFTDVEPGFHAMQVSAPLHLPAQVTAEVVAGETAKVRAQLPTDTTPQPYHLTYTFDGYMQAWLGIGEYYVQEEAGQAAPLCECRLYFTPEAKADTIVFEALWEPAVPDPAGQGEFYWVVEQVETGAYDADYCTSPCYARIGGGDYDAGKEMYARLDGPDNWPEYDQRFQLFVTTFHNGAAPDGWSALTSA